MTLAAVDICRLFDEWGFEYVTWGIREHVWGVLVYPPGHAQRPDEQAVGYSEDWTEEGALQSVYVQVQAWSERYCRVMGTTGRLTRPLPDVGETCCSG